jgi:hypothetical protein
MATLKPIDTSDQSAEFQIGGVYEIALGLRRFVRGCSLRVRILDIDDRIIKMTHYGDVVKDIRDMVGDSHTIGEAAIAEVVEAGDHLRLRPGSIVTLCMGEDVTEHAGSCGINILDTPIGYVCGPKSDHEAVSSRLPY